VSDFRYPLAEIRNCPESETRRRLARPTQVLILWQLRLKNHAGEVYGTLIAKGRRQNDVIHSGAKR
jgi:hypothetical protein